MKSVLKVCVAIIAVFLLDSCTPPKKAGVSNWAKEYPQAVGTATENARIFSVANTIIGCKFFLRVPPYGLVEFEPNAHEGMFTMNSRGSCSLVREGDRMAVAVTAYFHSNDQSPYKWSFETKGIYGELTPEGL